MSVAKNLEEYKTEIELIQAQNRVECDLYSIIAHILREGRQSANISLRDVSARRESEFSKFFRGDSGFPDFVVRAREKNNNAKILGAIEVKYLTKDLDSEHHLEQLRGHISFYKQVIYTNGLEWRFYNSIDTNAKWNIILGEINIISKTITWEKDDTHWTKLLDNLDNIEWTEQK